MRIRKTRYGAFDQQVTLAFISGIDAHPELIDDAPPPAPPPQPKTLAIDRPPRWTERNIRRALGRDRKQAARALRKVGFERTLHRITREGV